MARWDDSAILQWFFPPSFPSLDGIHGSDADSAQYCRLRLSELAVCEQLPHELHLFPGKPGCVVLFSAAASPFQNHVISIFPWRAKKEMVRIHTLAHVAAVAYQLARGDLATVNFPRYPVRSHCTAVEPNHSIAIGIAGAHPYPAAAGGLLRDFGFEAFLESRAHGQNWVSWEIGLFGELVQISTSGMMNLDMWSFAVRYDFGVPNAKRLKGQSRLRARKHQRLEARITPDQKQLIERAAQLRGTTVTEFVVASAQQAATDTIREFEVLTLRDRAREVFVNAILNPPVPNEAARAAALRCKRQLRG